LQDDSPGQYIITHRSAGVTATMDRTSPLVAELAAGVRVVVLEVVRRVEEKRVRALLEQPKGWISLMNLTTGYRWAKKQADEFEVVPGKDTFPGRNARRMPATSIEECRLTCKEHNYGAFVVHNGIAYFRREGVVQCRDNLADNPLSTTYLFRGQEATGTKEAERLLRRVLKGREATLGQNHSATLSACQDLAEALHAVGELQEAEQLYQQAIDGREMILGIKHLDTLQSFSRMAALQQALGNYWDAVPLLRRVLEGRELQLGQMHPDTLATCTELAVLLQDMGRHGEALPLYRRALEGRETVCGPNHPDTLQARNSLGMQLELMGRLREAEPIMRGTLLGNEATLGTTDPDTLTSLNNYAMLLKALGRLKESHMLLLRALEGCEEKLGPHHPDTLTTQNNIALLLQAMGDYMGAEPLHRKVLEGREKVLGPSHSETLTTLNNLAMLLKALGRHREALPLVQRSLNGCEKNLGSAHPDTLTTLSNLGMLLKAMGRSKEAEPLLRRTLAVRISMLGPSHPSTLTSINNLAVVLDGMDLCKEAELNHRRALKGREEVLGPNHPDTLNSLNNLAVLLQKMDRNSEAEPFMRKALEGCRKVLGDSHPDTLTTQQNLAALLEALGQKGEADRLGCNADPKEGALEQTSCLESSGIGSPGSVSGGAANRTSWALSLPVPIPDAVLFPDPRPGKEGEDVGVVGFFYPGREEVWDSMCGSGFLGGGYDLGPEGLQLEAPCRKGEVVSFRNSEAAFQALKFWSAAEDFSDMSGALACKRRDQLAGQEDLSFGGFGSDWAGMLAVLRAKFQAGTPCAAALVKTGDAFLLQHNTAEGSDVVWSDNRNGEGANWLGLQLMLVRDSLSGGGYWTSFVEGLIDTSTGQARGPEQVAVWQEAVNAATQALVLAIDHQQAASSNAAGCSSLRPGCSKPTWNGQLN